MQDDYNQLLADGGLCPAVNLVLSRQGASFDAAVAGICHTLHLCVIERVDGAVSLYGQAVDGKSVCLLCKETVSVTGDGF